MTTILLFPIFFGIFVWIVGSIVRWSIKNGISPMPTSRKVKGQLLGLLPEKLDGAIVELGSGWGTLSFPLAKKFPACNVIGYETSPIPFFISKIRQFFYKPLNLQLIRHDFFKTPLGNASLIVCYLYPDAMRKLKQKFENELTPGTWIISNTFAIPGWNPIHIKEVSDIYRTKIYLYKIENPT